MSSTFSTNSQCCIKARLMKQDSTGFGFEVKRRPGGPPFLSVAKLVKNGEADVSGVLRPGDIILRINDIDVSTCDYETAITVMSSLKSGQLAHFLIRAPYGYRTRLETTFNNDGLSRTVRITEKVLTEVDNSLNSVTDTTLEPKMTSNVNLDLMSSQKRISSEFSDEVKCNHISSGSLTQVSSNTNNRRPIQIINVSSKRTNGDYLHQNSVQEISCSNKVCCGSVMTPSTSSGQARSPEIVLEHAKNFLEQYYQSIKRLNSAAHEQRWDEVRKEVEAKGTYTLKETELIFGAKLAWRNAPRCIGRIQWSKLQVFDARNVATAKEMFDALCNHIKYATNKGNLRSAITVFPQRINDRKYDFRVWNTQLISYAGYVNPENPEEITGDPINVELTQLCQKLGWRGDGGQFDVLPLVLSAGGQDPQLFVIPDELILKVLLKHPRLKWFEQLKLQWHALPAVSSMLLDIGGIEFPAIPFSGWYMVTEIACRDLCDPHRYNVLKTVADKMGLDTRSNLTLWKDQALLEIHVAVLDSFQKAGVTIIDHHTASESFMKHMENEQRLRGGCPADWVWIVPPTSGGLTPVFHQEMLNYSLKPSYEYQEPAWKVHQWKNSPGSTSQSTPSRKIKFKEIARAVKFTSNLFGKALSKRIKATILFATETGRSEEYAKRLNHMFSHAFNVTVMCMDSYDTFNLEHEALLLVVTSTFGNGDPPENGEYFAKQLQAIKVTGDSTPDVESVRSISMSYLRISSTDSGDNSSSGDTGADHVGPLSNVRFAVFSLGSSAYPNFCAFGRFIDTMLSELGGERLMKVTTGDELCGQEQSFTSWSKAVFEVACEVFCISDDLNMKEVMKSATFKPMHWSKENVQIVPAKESEISDPVKGLTKGSNRKVFAFKLKKRIPLHKVEADEKSTISVQLESTSGVEDKDGDVGYLPGDHIGIFPENQSELVNGILKRLGITDCDSPITVLVSNESKDDSSKEFVPHEKLPTTTVRDALIRYLDITTPPTQQFLRLLASFCTAADEIKRLNELISDHEVYEDWRAYKFPNFLEVLEEFASLSPPLELLLTELPTMQPRFYSISSSPLYHSWQSLATSINSAQTNRLSRTISRPNTPTGRRVNSKPVRTEPQTPTSGVPTVSFTSAPTLIDLTVAVVRYKTHSGTLHLGVCSNFLSDIPIGHKVYGNIRSAPNFRLPDDVSTPVIMVGPGTGIAPFRGFWLHRYALSFINPNEKVKYGKMTLYFGCRVPSMQLYQDELMQMKEERILTDVYTAFSRVPNQPKSYVQDLLKKQSAEVFRELIREKGHIYVCGDVSMAEDVCKTVKKILYENGIKDTEFAMMTLREEMRYHEDIFGITLRTAEVTRKIRRKALTRRTLSSN